MKESQKTVTVGTQSYDALWQAVKKDATTTRPKGDGWKSAAEIVALTSMTLDAARMFARRKTAANKWECEWGRDATGRRCCYWRPRL